jgi:hypothetical protein
VSPADERFEIGARSSCPATRARKTVGGVGRDTESLAKARQLERDQEHQEDRDNEGEQKG